MLNLEAECEVKSGEEEEGKRITRRSKRIAQSVKDDDAAKRFVINM